MHFKISVCVWCVYTCVPARVLCHSLLIPLRLGGRLTERSPSVSWCSCLHTAGLIGIVHCHTQLYTLGLGIWSQVLMFSQWPHFPTAPFLSFRIAFLSAGVVFTTAICKTHLTLNCKMSHVGSAMLRLWGKWPLYFPHRLMEHLCLESTASDEESEVPSSLSLCSSTGSIPRWWLSTQRGECPAIRFQNTCNN